MKKRGMIPAALVFALLAGFLCSCGGGSGAEKVSMYELKSAMSAAADFSGEMIYASSADQNPEEIFANISDMDYAKVDGFFIYYASEGKGNADELAVIQVNSAADIAEAKEELEQHVSKRIALYSTYDKSQLGKLEAAKIEVDGGCVALIVCDGAEKAANAFHAFFAGE